jgi:acetyl-CoA carboxylase biotin carboxylase subunit
VAYGETREQAIARLQSALGEYYIGGIRTNLPFFRRVLADEAFAAGELHTGFLDQWLQRGAVRESAPVEVEAVAALVAALARGKKAPAAGASTTPASAWLEAGRRRLFR